MKIHTPKKRFAPRSFQSGNVFAMLFGAVALTGVLASVGMQTLTGPVTTITRVTQKNIADTQLLMDAKIIINAAVSGVAGGDPDADGIIEPAAFVAPGASDSPTNGGFLPTTLGLSLTDPWGTRYGYCVWDHGSTNSSTDRITGDNTVGATVQPVIAIIAAGPDKAFQTTCSAYAGGNVDATKAGGSDDLIFKYTYAEASANSNGLWSINTGDQAKAELKDSSGSSVNVTIDRDTGIGDFLGVTTSVISAKVSETVSFDGSVLLDADGSGTATVCDATRKGSIRLNTAKDMIEICDGTSSFVDLTGGTWETDGTHVWRQTGNVGIGTASPGYPLDVQGNTNISGNIIVGGTGSVTGNFIVNTDAISVDATNKRLGIGKAAPSEALDVVGNAYVQGDGVVTGGLTVDTNTLFVDATNDRVGIGTLSPAHVADVVGTTDMGALGSIDTSAAVVHVDDGTANLYMDGRAILSDTAFIVGTSEAVAFQIVTDEAARVTVAADGTVGIAGNANIGGNTVISGTLGVTGATTLSSTLGVTGNATFDTNTLFVDAANNEVGIGTVSPVAKLDVSGGIRIGLHGTCSDNGTIQFEGTLKKMQLCVDGSWTNISAIDKLNDIGDVDADSPTDNQVVAWDNATSTWKPKSISGLGPAEANPGGTDKQVQFNDGGSTLAGATQLIWDKTNNRLGLGATGGPAQTLDVTGTAAVSGDTTIGGTLGVTGNATFDTDTLFVDAAGDEVGIGTTTPLSKLDVAGAIKLSTQATCAGGGANNGTIRYDGTDLQMCKDGAWIGLSLDTAVGIAGSVPDAIDCGVSGNRRLLYLQTTTATQYFYQLISGAAGIGMQVAYNASDGSHDSTTNTAQWSNATGCDTKDLATLDSEGRGYYMLDGSGVVGAGGATVAGTDGALQFKNGSNLGADSANLFWDNSNKRLGIGTTAPTLATLQVKGNAPVLALEGTDHAYIAWYPDGAGAGRKGWTGWGVASSDDFSIMNELAADIVIGTGGTEKMRVLSNGNVGIGTATPSVKLDVNGAVLVRGNGTTDGTYAQLMTLGSGYGTPNAGDIRFGDNTGWKMHFALASDSGATKFMTIQDNGNVGIGTASPTLAKLQVSGNASGASSFRVDGTAGRLIVDHNGTGNNYMDGAVHYFRTYAGANRAYITSTNAYKPGGGSWAASSDARLKDVDGVYEHGLDSIVRLNTVRFHYKKGNPRQEPSERPFVGLIAQDVQKVIPEAVSERDDGYLDLDATPINFALINAIKELKALFDGHDARIEKLEAENAALKASLDALRSDVEAMKAARR